MSSNVPISNSNLTAPTPQNTPLNQAPISLGLSRPTVPDISEDNEQAGDVDDDGQPELSGLQQQMLGLMEGKLAGLLGRSSGYIESLPVDVKLNVEALKGVQVKQNELQNKYKRECLELEKKVRGIPLSSFYMVSSTLSCIHSILNSRNLCMNDVMRSSQALRHRLQRRSLRVRSTR